MKKVKGILWIIIIGILGVLVFQNQNFFLSRHSLGINLSFFSYRTMELPNVVIFAAFLFIGCLLAYVSGLADRYRSIRIIKALRQTNSDQQTAIDSMKNDIEALRKDTPSSQHRVEKTVDPPHGISDSPSVEHD